jgi:hypothetical protein
MMTNINRQNQRYPKILLVLAAIGVVTYFAIFFDRQKEPKTIETSELNRFTTDGIYRVKNYKHDEETMQNANSQQIFFLETHLHGHRRLDNARQACSVESAARTNPDMQVYLFMATNESEVVMDHTPLLDVLLSYPNIHVRYFNISEYTRGTKIEEFFKTNHPENSKFGYAHLSDIFRMLTLHKFGGLYLDLDVVSTFPVRIMNKKNFACLERNTHFSSAILKLDAVEGKKYTDKYLE